MAVLFENIEYKKGFEDREQRQDFLKQDKELAERTKDANALYRYLRRFVGVDVDIQEVELGVFELSCKNKLEDIPDLPVGYGYKGGAARAYLESALGISPSPARDLDIVFIGDNEDQFLSDELVKKYMPDDYKNGYGIEYLSDDYFETRDFTLNEVFVDGQRKIRTTRRCILDTVRRVLRLTEYEKRENFNGDDYWVKPKILAKALRFIVRESARGKSMKFADKAAIEWVGIDSFHMALHLDRAMEQGTDVAFNYIEELVFANQLPPDINTPESAAVYLMKDINDFVFKAPRLKGIDQGLTGEDESIFLDKEFAALDDLPHFESFSKGIKLKR